VQLVVDTNYVIKASNYMRKCEYSD